MIIKALCSSHSQDGNDGTGATLVNDIMTDASKEITPDVVHNIWDEIIVIIGFEINNWCFII
jgi:hypothetical protein